MTFAEISIRRPVTAIMFFVSMMVIGAIAAVRLPLEFFPAVDVPFVLVNIPYPGSTPAEIERTITRPVEEVISTLSGIKQMNSSSRPDAAQIFLQFDWGTDVAIKASEVRGKIDAIRSELVEKMIEDYRKEAGITPRKVSDDEIVQRLVYSLVNEAARILEEGIASKASDIDMVYLTGYGFPLWRGGPMCYADSQGLFNVAQAMKRFAQNPRDDARFWQPAPLLAKLVAEGKTFT